MGELVRTKLPTEHGDFIMYAYESGFTDFPHIVMQSESWSDTQIPFVRIHSECMTGDVFSSNKCDCGEQLNFSMKYITEHGGLILYLRQEGRGIGLINKMKAYNLQEQGYDTIQANLKLGLHQDARNYDVAIEILKDFNSNKIRLLTNNPDKVKSLEDKGIEIVERIPIEIPPKKENLQYLKTKKEQMGHFLSHVLD